jgi:hypothetical protein
MGARGKAHNEHGRTTKNTPRDLRQSQASKIALMYLPLCIQTLGLQCHWPLFLGSRCAREYCPSQKDIRANIPVAAHLYPKTGANIYNISTEVIYGGVPTLCSAYKRAAHFT